jgi:choline dehydrogenase-like flavoprotein
MSISSSIPDPIQEGLARGWRVFGGEQRPAAPAALDCDVVIVGSGAGAGITAEILARAGLSLVIVEEGPLKSSRDFRQREGEAYGTLYQEGGGRKTADKAMNVLQGRCVGGSTTINWTSSFRTPDATLAFWAERYGLSELTAAAMAPWFEQVERRLSIASWPTTPNANNAALQRGAARLGIATPTIRRNVKGCWDLGSCGMGCPTNAKQSMLVTTLPAALDLGATLLVQTRAERLEIKGGAVQALLCQPVRLDGDAAGAALRVRARHYVVAGGAINSPALLLRSGAPDPHQLLGTRTFLHPTCGSAARMPERIEGWSGAPQSVYSDHFQEQGPIDGPLGYKLEVPPIHPGFAQTNLGGIGQDLAHQGAQLPHTQFMLALLRDGFHPGSRGGRVTLRGDGSPVLDYALGELELEAVRRAHLSMAELQFAAGATSVRPVHEQARDYRSWDEARAAISSGLDYRAQLARVGSAHVMGGCAFGADAGRGVLRPDGRHWQLGNLSVHDGSVFPTSIGANPQLSVYGQANRLATGLARSLGGREVVLGSVLG